MTPTLNFTRQAIRVKAMRLEYFGDLVIAAHWLHSHGIPTSHINGVLHIRGTDGAQLTARLGQWLTFEPDTGYFAVYDGDERGPDGHVTGLGVVEQ